MKRQPMEWEKIAEHHHMFHKGLISKIVKKSYDSVKKKKKRKKENPVKKMGRGTEQTFFKRRHRWPTGT